MKIIVLDGYTLNPGDLSWDALRALGDVTVYDRTPCDSEQEIIRRIADAEVVYTNKTPINRRVLDACANLRYIGILATGYNVVDTAYARQKGIPVTNVPAYGTAAVAQLTIALLLEICHRIAHHSDAVYAGRWERCADYCFWDYPPIELEGKTMGIIGFGRIGQRTAQIARALGMQILACSPHVSEQGAKLAQYTDLDTLLRSSDVVCLHCPLTPQTTGIINCRTIEKMKDHAIVLNTSRGALIVEQDLADALNSGKIAAAGLDVVSAEPIRGDNPLLQAKNCFITPHFAWAAVESRRRLMDCAVRNLEAFLAGTPVNVVN